jgi:GMP synthase (glutamine-hydrolysing)
MRALDYDFVFCPTYSACFGCRLFWLPPFRLPPFQLQQFGCNNSVATISAASISTAPISAANPQHVMTTASLPVLIIHTGEPDEKLKAAHGGYAAFMQHAAGLADGETRAVAVYLGEKLEDPACYRAALITGSPAMVTDKEPWSEQTAQWLRDAARQELPMFGVCYGHQLLAHALGGEVAYNPAGREVGTFPVWHLGSDALLAETPREFAAQMMHAQSVIQPPPGSVVLGQSAMDPHQILRIGRNIYSTQFHPEFTPAFVRAHLERYREHYAGEGIDAGALAADVRPTPYAGSLIARFLQIYAPAQTPAPVHFA